MTPDVRMVALDAPVEDVVRLMERHHIKRVPVVERGKIVSIVTRANLLHAMASFVHEVAPPSADDKAIRKKMLDELKTQPLTSIIAIDVAVRNGVVQLSGTPHFRILCIPAERVSLAQPIDTSSAAGKCFLDMLGVFAEFETNLRRVISLPASFTDDNVTKAWWGDCWHDRGGRVHCRR
jgi:CBS domain